MDDELYIIVNEILNRYGLKAIGEMVTIAPVRTGYLRDSFRMTPSFHATLQVYNLAYYSGFVDRGTRFMEPRNFTAPFYDGLTELETEIGEGIGQKMS